MTENKAIDDLLKPRYKVIAAWPTMLSYGVDVGDIITESHSETARNQHGDATYTWEWEAFPHLFKRLEWWEERQESEMPKYIKHEGMIVKVDSYVMGVGFNFYYGESAGYGKRAFMHDTLPATEAEYLNYQKQKS